MLEIVAPVFSVILIGYIFGKIHSFDAQSDRLINDYVLYIALPALLFLALARADPEELGQWAFLGASLGGIVAAYGLGLLVARYVRIGNPRASIVGMGACYGTTGYMGVPILISVFGEEASVPAAVATIVHNIPAIMAVIISHDLHASRREGRSPGQGNAMFRNAARSMSKALKTTLSNPLTVAVIAGALFSLFAIPLPRFLESLAGFLGAAAGPTALFALGLALARLKTREHLSRENLKLISPMLLLKLIVQPALTFIAAFYLFGMDVDDLWLIAAVVMAAQPIGAGVYVFAGKYGFKGGAIPLAIVISLPFALLTLSLILKYFAPA